VIKELGYEEPTEIQEKCIPLVKEGRDVVAQSQTGSGKTAVFGFPVLEKITPGKPVQMLVLTPTRELCLQDKDALESYSKYLGLKIVPVFGGVGYEPQIHGIRNSEVVVGTPGRILDHLSQGNLNLKGVKWLVLDEADKMFEMGFIDDVEKIIGQTSKERQTMLFSATFSSEIHSLIEKHLNNPIRITAKIYIHKSKLHQVFYNVDQHDKFSLLVHLLKKKTTGLALVFCATRDEVSLLTKNLYKQGIDVMAIHGGLAQAKRTKALELLKGAKIDVLVATDVAARGLDIKGITHIYNYDVPKTSVEYIHRIGRTARAGHQGDAVTLLSQRDFENFDRVLGDHSLEISQAELPQFERVRFITTRDDDDEPRRGGFRGRSREGGFVARGPRAGYGRSDGFGDRRESGTRERRDGTEGSTSGGGSTSSSEGFRDRDSSRQDRAPPARSFSSRREGPSRSGGFGARRESFGRREGGFRGGPRGGFGDRRGGGFGDRREGGFGNKESSGERMIEISGGFGEKPKLVSLSSLQGGKEAGKEAHSERDTDHKRPEGSDRDRRKPSSSFHRR
jgi:ATP-dependent RNA helicase DeaD